MTSRERILAAIEGKPVDRAPLTTWCFGFPAPAHLRWETEHRPVDYWFSMRMEHLHTLARPWRIEDDFKRVDAWLSAGLDDVLDVSVPWSVAPAVWFVDSKAPAGRMDAYPVMTREYHAPSGVLRHSVRQTGEEGGEGWVIQPDHVPLIEDFNIPRAVEHAVSSPADVPIIRELYGPPNDWERGRLETRLDQVKTFADEKGVAVQAWSAFGMDAIVWFCGTENAVLMAVDEPEAFGRLAEIVAETDRARTELAVGSDAVDIIVQRGWYSSTDFWSPALFDRFVYPHVERLARVVHDHGKKFAYVMTTGVEKLGPRLADAGVDLLYFVDPLQDGISLQTARDLFGDRMAMAGGINALTLAADPERIRTAVRRAVDVLGPTNRFILHPVDAIFPDTPWSGIETMIDAWRDR